MGENTGDACETYETDPLDCVLDPTSIECYCRSLRRRKVQVPLEDLEIRHEKDKRDEKDSYKQYDTGFAPKRQNI